MTYNEPGLYCEELFEEDNQGNFDKDFVLVRIFDPRKERKNSNGWIFYYPHVIKTGDKVLFWHRIIEAQSPVLVNFGDENSTRMKDEITHVFEKSGNYAVSFKTTGYSNELVMHKVEVVVLPVN